MEDPSAAQSVRKERLVRINTAPAHNPPSHDPLL
jgi:hypothetical protein